MPFVRRRPLLRAAAVGGIAYHAGKRSEQRQADEQQQAYDEGYAAAQPQAAPPPAAAPSGGMSDEVIRQLKELGDLHTQGILTDTEFEAQKQKLLAGG